MTIAELSIERLSYKPEELSGEVVCGKPLALDFVNVLKMETQMSDARQKANTPEPGTSAAAYGLSIRRIGNVVHLSLSTADDYRGIELYELLCKAAKNGKLQLDLKTASNSR